MNLNLLGDYAGELCEMGMWRFAVLTGLLHMIRACKVFRFQLNMIAAR